MTETLTFSLNIGDSVVYPSHGAGVIHNISDHVVMGKQQSYFEIELLKSGMQVKVPVVHAQNLGLRLITPSSELPELLSSFAKPDLDLPVAWTPRHRREQTILQDGNIYIIAQLVGTLHRRMQIRNLAVTERAIYDEAKKIIATEVAVSKSIEIKKAIEEIDILLEQAVAA